MLIISNFFRKAVSRINSCISYLPKYLQDCKDGVIRYHPKKYTNPQKTLELISAWKGLEKIIPDILDRFKVERRSCIEFGVEYGYSTVVFSNYFERVVGVDIFYGDIHTVNKIDHYEETRSRLKAYPNIELIKSDYRDYIAENDDRYDFAHVDIVHTYEDTYACGLWAVEHCDVVIFHDTESFNEVRQALIAISKKTGKYFYNYPNCYGLGIITSKPPL